jgi:hypothetical protein
MSDSNTKLVMILEKSTHNLDVNQDSGEVVLQGTFAQFGVVNNNDRLYEESEYLPHLEYLQKKIKENRLLGELDHPEKFDISLSKTSHIIEHLEYDKSSRQIKGRVRLLDTPAGRIAKDLVKAGVPISISSRAAGLVESNKKVKIKKIFTYDLVADPGFENAVLSKMNESLGIHSDLIAVYDMTEKYPELMEDTDATPSSVTEESTKTNKQSAMDFVTTDEMNAYSIFVKEEFEKLQEKFNELNEKNSNSDLVSQISSLNENMEKMQKYLDYLANTSDKSIQYTEYVAERLDRVIDYTNYVAKTLDESIAYTEHVAEKADSGIQYTEYLKEQLEKGIAYSEYLKECLEKTVDYAEHIAEKADQGIQYSEYVGEKLGQTISYAEYLGESLEKGIAYTEYVAEQTQVVADYAEYALTEAKISAAEKDEPAEEEEKEDKEEKKEEVKEAKAEKSEKEDDINKEEDKEDSVKESLDYNSLPSKVDQLIESINKQKVEQVNEKHFGVMMLLDEAKRTEFRRMDESTKQKVLNALNDKSVQTEEDANKIWESVLTPYVEKWIEDAPQEYKQLWESLDAKSKEILIAQSRTYKLETAYQIKNFWETRPASILKKTSAQAINESEKTELPINNPLGYSPEYIKAIGDLLGKRK